MSIVKNKSCRLRDVAEEAGLALATVSEILNNKPCNYSSEETRQRVRHIAQKLGYRTNFGYKLMHGQKTHTVAIMNSMPRMNNEEYILSLILQMIPEFDRLGYAAYCGTFTHDAASNLAKIKVLIWRGVEHFIFLGSPFGHEDIIKELEKNDLSYVSNSGNFKRCVNNGLDFGTVAIFNHLKEHVGSNFKLICQEKELTNPHNSRIDGLNKVFPELSREQVISNFVYTFPNIEFSIEDYRHVTYDIGYNTTRELLNKIPTLGGIVYTNDLLAIGGGGYLMEKDNESLRSILLYGFNNDHMLNSFPLPISSIRHDIERQAKILVKHSLEKAVCQETVFPALHIRTTNFNKRYPHWDETVISCAPQ
ncbi:MAG: LacI family DNA-binding transcriptional regulator [Victivallaceae bacterium]